MAAVPMYKYMPIARTPNEIAEQDPTQNKYVGDDSFKPTNPGISENTPANLPPTIPNPEYVPGQTGQPATIANPEYQAPPTTQAPGTQPATGGAQGIESTPGYVPPNPLATKYKTTLNNLQSS